MDKRKVSEFIINQLNENCKQFPSKGQDLSYRLGVTIGILTELCNRDSENYYYLRKKFKELGAPNKN